jgi:hypothetical protein
MLLPSPLAREIAWLHTAMSLVAAWSRHPVFCLRYTQLGIVLIMQQFLVTFDGNQVVD